MTSKPNPKTGRPADYVRDEQGRPIVGLSQNRTDGRYYATHSKPRKWFGKDYHVAKFRFDQWKAQGELEPLDDVATQGTWQDYWRAYYRNLIATDP